MQGLRARHQGGDEQGTALLLVILAIWVATTLSLLSLGLVLSQTQPTQFERKNTRSIHAAEAGLDAAIGQIRAATKVDPLQNNAIVGDRTKLPCGPVTGTVGGEPGSVVYSAAITYYNADPANAGVAGNPSYIISCSAGSGAASTPSYALIQSTGSGTGVPGLSATQGNRSLVTVYNFKLTNVGISGGLIHTYPDGATGTLDLCWDAGSANPSAGTPVKLQACSAGSLQQEFAYQANLTIVLADTSTGTLGTGMCVDAAPPGSGTAAVAALLEPCNGSAEQTWSLNDVASLQASNASLTLVNWCLMNQTDNTAGSALVLAYNQCGGPYNRDSTWDPDAKVGAGAAGSATQQLVNFGEFGRCFDITGQNVNASFMIDYPCKQNPNPNNIAFNQRFQYDSTNHWLYTTTGGQQYCAQAPTTSGGYVLTPLCNSTAASQRWTLSGDTGTYSTSYTIVDTYGRCLGLGPPGSTVAPLNEWSTITSSSCTGGLNQKWNAPSNLTPAATTNTRETTSG